MGRWFVSLLVVGTLTAFSPGQADKKPIGTISPPPKEGEMFGETVHDFGTVPRGSQLLHRFQWRNTTTQALELVEYQRSCGCTSVSISPHTVEPGQLGFIDMHMDTKPFAGDKSVNLSLVFGPGKQISAQFQVKATSRGDIVYNPGQFSFGSIHENAAPVQTMEIEYAGNLDWKIEGVAAKPAGVEVKIAEAYRRPGAVGYRITASLGSGLPSGDYKQTIQLRTNDPSNPVLPLLVEATVRAAVTVVPDNLFYGTVKVGQAMSRRVTLRSSTPFRILAVDGQNNGLHVTLPTASAAVHSILIQWKPSEAGEMRAELRIHTDHERFPIVSLPVSGMAQ